MKCEKCGKYHSLRKCRKYLCRTEDEDFEEFWTDVGQDNVASEFKEKIDNRDAEWNEGPEVVYVDNIDGTGIHKFEVECEAVSYNAYEVENSKA